MGGKLAAIDDSSDNEVHKNTLANFLSGVLNNTHIMALMLIPVIVAVVILFGGLEYLYRQGFDIKKDGIFGILIALSYIIASLSGFVQIYRKETYGFHVDYPIRGAWALICGWTWLVVTLSMAAITIWEAIKLMWPL